MKKFLFVGNRRFVLEEMLALNLQVEVVVISNTHLAKEPFLNDIEHTIISEKQELLDIVSCSDAQVLISNGCPFILPVDDMKPIKYVNIHPSFLPDLKGIDPCLGAILFERDAGATCYIMNMEIDAGKIISRVKIPYTADLDVSLLYQMTFVAEKQVFREAYDLNFEAKLYPENAKDCVYYSRKQEDRIICFDEKNTRTIQRVKTFNNKSQGCFLYYNGRQYKVHEACIISNPFLLSCALRAVDREIIFSYEDTIIVKNHGEILKLSKIVGNIKDFVPGTLLEHVQKN